MDEQGKLTKVGDGYRNVVANLGTDRDKATGGSYVTVLHNASELLTMYRSSWLARKIVDIPAFDSIRRWRNWNAEKDDITKIENEERRLGLQKKVHSGLTLARLYGGAAIFISTKESEVSKPLSANEEITHLTVIPRQMLVGDLTQTDISSSRFGLPVFYTVNSAGISTDTGGQQKIHHSRLVKFTGAEIPWGDTQIHEDWGDSVLTATMDAIHRADSTAANIASLVFEAKVDVIHVPKLMQLISTPEGEIAVKEYIRLAMQTKSVNGALILDGGDTTKSENESGGTRYDSKSASFAGLDSVFDRFLQAVSGAADIPATRLLGQAPAGMNATGESDLRNYYDHIQSIQTIELGPEMAMLDEMLVHQATGKGIGEIWYDWRPLWQPTDEQKLAAGKQVAGIVGDMAKLRLWPDEVLSKAGANAMVETGALPGLEAAIDEWTDEEGDLFVEPCAGEGEPDLNQPTAGGNVVTLEGRQKRANVKDANPYHIADMAPRSLYVRRDVLNADEILEWAREQGIQNLLPAEELHTTVVYSKQPIDWMRVGEAYEDELEIKAGGPRSVEQFGAALVLEYSSFSLAMRHGDAERAGATWDHDEYRPHITLSYDPAVDPEDVEPYRGPIELGPEIFENLDPTKSGGDATSPFVETADANPNHHPAGAPGGKGGEFAPKPGGPASMVAGTSPGALKKVYYTKVEEAKAAKAAHSASPSDETKAAWDAAESEKKASLKAYYTARDAKKAAGIEPAAPTPESTFVDMPDPPRVEDPQPREPELQPQPVPASVVSGPLDPSEATAKIEKLANLRSEGERAYRETYNRLGAEVRSKYAHLGLGMYSSPDYQRDIDAAMAAAQAAKKVFTDEMAVLASDHGGEIPLSPVEQSRSNQEWLQDLRTWRTGDANLYMYRHPTKLDAAAAQYYTADRAPMIAVPSSKLNAILDSGVKNFSQTGKRGSKNYDIQFREDAEDAVFGTYGVTPEQRPVYGFLGKGKDTETISFVAENYGDAVLTLRASTRERASITFGDSLDSNAAAASAEELFRRGEIRADVRSTRRRMNPIGVGTPARLNDPLALAEAYANSFGRDDYTVSEYRGGVAYIEAQIWGGVAASDIESVKFTTKAPSDAVLRKLKKKGIKVELSGPMKELMAGNPLIADAKDYVLARLPDVGSVLVAAGENALDQQLAVLVSPTGKRSEPMILEAFLKFGDWEMVDS